jgi:hypothetical protein
VMRYFLKPSGEPIDFIRLASTPNNFESYI